MREELDAAPAGPSRGARFRQWLGAAGAAFLGGVLLVAAWTKMIDPESFVELVEAEHLDFLFPARIVAFLALAAEVGIGTSLLLGLRRRQVLVPAALLTVFFLFLTGRTYVLWLQGSLDEGHNCGCFGHLVERSPAQAFWQDAAMLVPALALSFLGRVPAVSFPFRRAVAAGSITVVAVLFSGFAPELPLDDLATRLKVGSQLSDVCIGTDKPPEGADAEKKASGRVCVVDVIPLLAAGKHVVVMADLEDPAVAARVEDLNAFFLQGLDGAAPMLWVLTPADAEGIDRFAMLRGASFREKILHAPSSLLRPLYRRLPRSFRVVDGTVVETYDGLPPLGSLVSAPPG